MNTLPFIPLGRLERLAFSSWVAMQCDGAQPFVTSDETFRPSFSLVCTVMRRFARRVDDTTQDLNAWYAPSECAALVYRALDAERREALKSMGYDEDTFAGELVARTSYRWAHFSGI